MLTLISEHHSQLSCCPIPLCPVPSRAYLSSTPSVAGQVLVSVPLSSSGSPQTMARRVSLSSASTLHLHRCHGHCTPSYVSLTFIFVVLPLLTSLHCPLPHATHIVSTPSSASVPCQCLGLCCVDAMACAASTPWPLHLVNAPVPHQRLHHGHILFTVD